MNNIADVSMWLSGHVRNNMPVGIDVQYDPDSGDYVIAFAGRMAGDEVGFAGSGDDDGAAVMRRFLDTKDGLKLVPFSIPEAVAILHMITKLDPHIILERMVGDVFSIEYTIGRGHPAQTNPIEEARYAITFWTAGQQMVLPKFYTKVMEPLQRMMAVPVPEEGKGWMCRFSELPIRVLAKYSQEPLLIRALMDDEYPSFGRVKDTLMEAYPDINHAQTYACLLYAALGGDWDYFSAEYADWASTIKDFDRTALGHNLDKFIPNVRLMATGLWQAGSPARTFETLYGRKLPFEPEPGQGPGVFLDHVVGGTVIDIIHVFCVSAGNLGVRVSPPFINGSELTIDIYGRMDGDVYERANQLKAIAGLAGPLNPIPLNPTVMLEGENGTGFRA